MELPFLFYSHSSFHSNCRYQRFRKDIHITYNPKILTAAVFAWALPVVGRRSNISWVKTGLMPPETDPPTFSLDSIRMQPTNIKKKKTNQKQQITQHSVSFWNNTFCLHAPISSHMYLYQTHRKKEHHFYQKITLELVDMFWLFLHLVFFVFPGD